MKKRADFAKSGQWDIRIKDNKGLLLLCLL